MKTRCSVMLVAGLLVSGLVATGFAQALTGPEVQTLIKRESARLARAETGMAASQPPATTKPPATPKPSTSSTPQVPSMPPMPPAVPAATSHEPVMRLSLNSAVQDALKRNLNIAVQRLNPQTYDYSLAELRATYLPQLNSHVSATGQTTPATSLLAGGKSINATNQTYDAGLLQNIPWAGGSLSVSWNNTRATTTNSFTTFNPAFNTTFLAQYTQPLLRGFSIDSTRQQLQVTKLNQDISDIQLRATIVNTLSDVRDAYWNLVYAVQAVGVAQQSVSLAKQLVDQNQIQVQVGTMAPLDVAQAQSQLASAQLALVQAEATRRTDELALKQLIVSGTSDPIWSASIDPTDRPEFRPEKIDLSAAIKKALNQRTDIQIAQKDLASNNVTLKFLHNQILPQADLVASYGAEGLGGTQFLRSGLGSSSTVLGTIPGGYTDALSSLAGFNYPTWTVGLTFSYPFGTSSADAAVAKARLQVTQTEAQMRQIELQIATDVTNAVLQVQSSVEAVQSARLAREYAEKELQAEQTKFDVGMSTNYLVVQAQRDLAQAQNAELQATLNYRMALVQLDRAEQTTLQSSGVTIVSSGGLNNSAVGSGRPTVVAGGGA